VAMKIQVRTAASVKIIDCSGDIDLYSSTDLREALLAQMQSGTEGILVNMTEVTYIDSSGVATLVEGLQLSRQTKTKFGLFGMRANARSVLQLARLDKIFVIFDNEEQALLGIPSVQPFGGV
jgi:anti-sigma B factor antagonist